MAERKPHHPLAVYRLAQDRGDDDDDDDSTIRTRIGIALTTLDPSNTNQGKTNDERLSIKAKATLAIALG